MEPRQIADAYGEVSGLPAPVCARVREEQLPEIRVYTVTAGEPRVSLSHLSVTLNASAEHEYI